MVHEHPGVSPLRRLGNVRALDEKQFVFDAMLSGWSDQQASRALSWQTIASRVSIRSRGSHSIVPLGATDRAGGGQ